MHRILSRRMPTLELIHERFARTMRLQLFNMIRCRCEVDLHPPRIKPYGEFLGSFPERTNINIVNIKSLRGVACWIVDPAVIYLTIDNMFGGEGHLEPKIVPKEYTATELRIVRRFVDMVLAEYEKAWRQVYELKFDFVRSEGNFQFAKITGNDEMVLHCKFTIDI
ncbi:MAG: flagellar motor switch protein FliM, partial [Betaproteobacteria bacterium]|nr:flagellar motor switch protein FliM [Betaproteobacteria bacterium]